MFIARRRPCSSRPHGRPLPRTNTQFGKVLSTAGVPSSPSSPKTIEYTVLALIFGLVAGMGVALLINAVSTNRK